MGDATTLTEALESLKEKGIDARANYMCCGSCAVAGIASESGDDADFAYWHDQDDERAFPREDDRSTCWSCGGSGEEECSVCSGLGAVGDEDCFECGGDGALPCDDCGGDGEIREDATRRTGEELIGDLYIGYGGATPERSVEVGRMVREAIEAAGYEVEWDGDAGTRLKVVA
jgi:hypothetical protein